MLGASGVALALAAGTALHALRQREARAWESIWAEDGSVFLADAHRDFIGTLFEQNGGYVHLVPRLIAGVAAVLPLDEAATVFAVGGAAVVALIAILVYFASSQVLPSRVTRLALAGAVVVLPIVGDELYSNALNLHFYLVFACFWALVWQAESPTALAARGAVVVAASLSDPVTALLLPLAVVAPLVRRTRGALAVSALYAAGVLLQAALMRGGESPERNWEFHLGQLPDVFSLRVTGGLLVGDRFLDDLWLSYGRAFSYVTLLVIAGAIVYLLLRSSRTTAAFATMCIVYGGLFLVVHLAGRGTGGIHVEPGSFHLDHARYALLPFLFTLTALIVLLTRADLGRLRWLRIGALVWLVALLAANYAVGPNARSSGPRWANELEQARQACARDPSGYVEILVAPVPPEVWFTRIDCSKL